MSEFQQQTRPKFELLTCTVGEMDCRYRWKFISTFFGECLSLNANYLTQTVHSQGKFSPFPMSKTS